VGLIANWMRIVNNLGDPLVCVIWGATYGHMAHLTAAKAKSLYRDKADRVLENDSFARGLAAADTLTVELDAPYMAKNGTRPVYFAGKLTATSMGKTIGEMEAELLAVYANNFHRSKTLCSLQRNR
jgi:tetrahydromethanopterin S-methyltransferase subunit E